MFKMFNWLNPVWLVENFLTCYWFSSDPAPQPTNTTVQNTNIPDYAQPYVTNMLEATQRQLFNMDPNGNITGFNKYQPYSTNPANYVAGFSPLQQNAQQGVGGLQLPGQYGQASGLAGMAGMGSMGVANQAGAMGQAGNNYFNMATNPNATQAFMNPYLQASLNPQLDEIRRQYGITGTQEQSAATQQGAFGGSREALMAAENNRNMNMGMNQAIGQGYNNAFQAAQQAQQFGSNLGLQGQQAAANAALQGYGQANTAANTLGQLGQQQLQGQQNILNQQNQFGQQQQQQQQNIINQDVQNYANAQQYPMMQLGMMSNMLRGLPMQGLTTQSYSAQPFGLQQVAGLAGSMATQPSTTGTKAAGGILEADRYNIGGAVKGDISKMPTDKLTSLMASTPSDIVKGDIQSELALRNTGAAQNFKAGGVLAFTPGGSTGDPDLADAVRSNPNVAISYEQYQSLPKELQASHTGKVYFDPTQTNTEPKVAASEQAGKFLKSVVEPSRLAKAAAQPSGIPFDITDLGNRVVDYGTSAVNRLGKSLGIIGANEPALQFTSQKTAPAGGYVPTAAESAKPTAAQAAATAAAMKGTPEAAKEEPKKEEPKTEKPKGNPKSILAAEAPTAAATQMPTVQSLSEDYLKSLSPDMQEIAKNPAAAEAKATSVEQAMKERQAMEDRFLDPALVAARKEDRANAMAQKANVPEELKRRKEIRENNFWNTLGSTPGPVIATALKATMAKNEAELADTDWGKKATKDANELIAKLNDSDYMIQQGHIEKGMAVHEKAVDDVRKWFTLIEENKAKYLQTGATLADSNLRAATSAAGDASRERVARMNAANDAERNRIEKIKTDNMPNKADTASQANWSKVFDTVYTAESKNNPELATEKALQAANLTLQKGAKSLPKYDNWGKDLHVTDTKNKG